MHWNSSLYCWQEVQWVWSTAQESESFLSVKSIAILTCSMMLNEHPSQLKKKRSNLPYFPPKSVMKWNLKVLEARRQGLEAYLQVCIAPSSSCVSVPHQPPMDPLQDVVGGSELPRALLTFLHLPNLDSTSIQSSLPSNLSSYDSAEWVNFARSFSSCAPDGRGLFPWFVGHWICLTAGLESSHTSQLWPTSKTASFRKLRDVSALTLDLTWLWPSLITKYFFSASWSTWCYCGRSIAGSVLWIGWRPSSFVIPFLSYSQMLTGTHFLCFINASSCFWICNRTWGVWAPLLSKKVLFEILIHRLCKAHYHGSIVSNFHGDECDSFSSRDCHLRLLNISRVISLHKNSGLYEIFSSQMLQSFICTYFAVFYA